MARGKKPGVRPDLRREWFRKHENEGQSITEIAKKDGFDPRTVKTQIELERELKDMREGPGQWCCGRR